MRKNKPALIKLYLTYHINKTFMIMLSLVLIFWIFILVSNSGYPFNLRDYLDSYPTYHQKYYQESFIYLNILNGVLVAFIVGSEVRTEEKFDPLFVSFVSRRKIITSRLIANIILILLIISCEILTLCGIGMIIFPKLEFNIEFLKLIPYTMIYLTILVLVGEVLVKIFPNLFVSFLVFIIHLAWQMLFQNPELNDKIINYIPSVSINEKLMPIMEGNVIIYIGISLIIYMLVLLLYQKKDIKTNL